VYVLCMYVSTYVCLSVSAWSSHVDLSGHLLTVHYSASPCLMVMACCHPLIALRSGEVAQAYHNRHAVS
jgi:hypothetical protein